MRVYGHAYGDTMKLPMRVFWHLSGSVPRLLASEHRTTLEMATLATHNPDAAGEMFKTLGTYAPDPVTLSAKGMVAATSVRDEEGFSELKRMAG